MSRPAGVKRPPGCPVSDNRRAARRANALSPAVFGIPRRADTAAARLLGQLSPTPEPFFTEDQP